MNILLNMFTKNAFEGDEKKLQHRKSMLGVDIRGGGGCEIFRDIDILVYKKWHQIGFIWNLEVKLHCAPASGVPLATLLAAHSWVGVARFNPTFLSLRALLEARVFSTLELAASHLKGPNIATVTL